MHAGRCRTCQRGCGIEHMGEPALGWRDRQGRAGLGPRRPHGLRAVLGNVWCRGCDPPYTLKGSLWPQGGEEAGGGRQEGDRLFGGCSRVQVRHDSGLDKGCGQRKGKQEWIQESNSEFTPFLLPCA